MNTSDSSTMFAHIVSRLTNRTEDVAVDALGFILSRSDAARRALRDLLKLEGLDVGELTGAATQVGDGTLARPDLAVRDRERKERVLIEAKFWAGPDRESTQRLPRPAAARRTAGRAPVRRPGGAPGDPLARTAPAARAAVRLAAGRNAA